MPEVGEHRGEQRTSQAVLTPHPGVRTFVDADPARVRYVAEPRHVREVTLRGTADLAWWTARLAPEKLHPKEHQGRAQILIVAAEMKYLGIRFAEVSFSVMVAVPGQELKEGAFLLHAFNSCRFFAFCERRLFATPYSYAQCRVSIGSPAKVDVTGNGGTIFHARMGPGDSALRQTTSLAEETWAGPIFLPSRAGRKDKDARLFFGRMRGPVFIHRFVPTTDLATLSTSAGGETVRALLDSKFAPSEWRVRPDATHGKSKTYRRRDLLGMVCEGSD